MENKISKNDIKRSGIVGKQVSSLLQQVGITVVGFSHGANISLNHCRAIKNGKASISSKTAGKIADFFNIETGLLFLSKTIKLKDPLNIPTIQKFYAENGNNSKFFISKAKSDSFTHFFKTILISDNYLNEWRRSGELVEYAKTKYRKIFDVKLVSKALGRIYMDSDILDRDDLRKNGKVFRYRFKNR